MSDNTTLRSQTQANFVYSRRELEWLWLCLSRERMQPYLAKARQDEWVAFHLYMRNTELSVSLFGIVQALEVGLRNIVHAKLSEVVKSEMWWEHGLLRDAERNDVEEAKDVLVTRTSRPVKAGQIVAELSFGFWVKLFANSYEKLLWVPSLSTRFPAKLSRKLLHERLSELKGLRNRIAHHETLLRRDTEQDYLNLLETLGSLSPTYKRWVEHTSDFPGIYAKRLPKQPKE